MLAVFAAYIDSNGYDPLSLVNTNIIKVILMMAMCFVLYIVNPRDKVTRNFKTIILVCCVVYITHIFPVRIVMIVCDLTFCFILFVIFRHFFKLTLFFFFPYFLKLMYNYLINTDSPETNAIELFFSYPKSHSLSILLFLSRSVIVTSELAIILLFKKRWRLFLISLCVCLILGTLMVSQQVKSINESKNSFVEQKTNGH